MSLPRPYPTFNTAFTYGGTVNNVNGDLIYEQPSEIIYTPKLQHMQRPSSHRIAGTDTTDDSSQDATQPNASGALPPDSLKDDTVSRELNLDILGDMLREEHHTMSPFFDPVGWERAEVNYTNSIAQKMMVESVCASPDQNKCLREAVHRLSKLYPRLFLFQLARSAFQNTRAPSVLDEYADSAACLVVVDEIRDDLLNCQDIHLDLENQPEMVATIDAIVRIDIVGAAVQRQLVALAGESSKS